LISPLRELFAAGTPTYAATFIRPATRFIIAAAPDLRAIVIAGPVLLTDAPNPELDQAPCVVDLF
jgi:hypothetical protein